MPHRGGRGRRRPYLSSGPWRSGGPRAPANGGPEYRAVAGGPVLGTGRRPHGPPAPVWGASGGGDESEGDGPGSSELTGGAAGPSVRRRGGRSLPADACPPPPSYGRARGPAAQGRRGRRSWGGAGPSAGPRPRHMRRPRGVGAGGLIYFGGAPGGTVSRVGPSLAGPTKPDKGRPVVPGGRPLGMSPALRGIGASLALCPAHKPPLPPPPYPVRG
jgi:hypothetical protein